MLVAVYENKRYQTFYIPYEKKEELKRLFAEEGIKWYTMSWFEGEEEYVNKAITAEVG
jgi:hypothetical protein|tara:strand:+ start:64 stop:237 length:174 start_codon:yes stop_codon:yes gene_type:complete